MVFFFRKKKFSVFCSFLFASQTQTGEWSAGKERRKELSSLSLLLRSLPRSPPMGQMHQRGEREKEREREREREKEREKERKEKQTAKVNCTGIQIAIFMAWKKGFFRRVLETIFFNQCLMKSDLISKLRTKLSSKKKVQLLYLFKQTSAMRASDLSSKFYTAENSMNVFSF